MRIRGVVASAVLAVVLVCGVGNIARANILAVVDKSTQSMTVSVDGQWRWTWPVSTGVAGYDTPSGQYTAFRMEAEHFSKEFDDAPMPHSVFFTQRGHAIHGSLHSQLGRPASHGCVRLSPEHAAAFYALVEEQGLPHTKIVIEGEIPTAPMVADRGTAATAGIRDLGFRMPWSDTPRARSYERQTLRERQATREQQYYAAPRAYAPPANPFFSALHGLATAQPAPRVYAPRTYAAPRGYAPPRPYARPRGSVAPRAYVARRNTAHGRNAGPRAYYDPRVEVTEETYVNGVKVRRHYMRRAVPGDFAGWR